MTCSNCSAVFCIYLVVSSGSYPQTLENSYNQSRSRRSHSSCLQCCHSRVPHCWSKCWFLCTLWISIVTNISYNPNCWILCAFFFSFCRSWNWQAMPPKTWRWNVSPPVTCSLPSVGTRSWTPLSKQQLLEEVSLKPHVVSFFMFIKSYDFPWENVLLKHCFFPPGVIPHIHKSLIGKKGQQKTA